MTKGLTGIPSLAYVGVNAGSPPNIKMYKRSPTTDDSKNFIIGDLWLNITPTPAASRELWILVALLGNYATWVRILPSTGGGGGNLRSDDALISIPDAFGAINVTGGQPYAIGSDAWLDDPVYSNIFTAANPVNNTLQVVLKRSIMQPKGTADGTRGLYGIDGDDFMHGFGTGNTMLGPDAGNRTLDVIAAKNNTCIGYNTLQSIFTANHCTGLGFNVLSHVSESEYLIAIGQNAGDNYNFSESSDILIGNPGVIGENNVIRIGVMGNGNAEQNQVFVAGIWNCPAIPVVNTGLVIVDDSGQLYVDDLAINSVIMTDAGGNPIAVKGAVGTVLTGQGAGLADPTPAFLPITSSGGTVTISTDPITNAINLEAAGVAGLVQLTTDAGVALPLAGNINVLGGELIETDAAVANTVTVNLTRGADHQVIVGNTGAASTYRTLFSSDGSISVDFTNPAQVDLKLLGVPPVGGVNALYDHALLSVPPTLNHIQIEQGANITTVGDVATSKITVSVTDNVTLAGWLHAAGEIQTTGVGSCLISDHGHLQLPNTDVSGIGGQIQFAGTRWISNYGTNNTFVGGNAGFLGLDTSSATNCTFIGHDAGKSHESGESNTAVGSAALDAHIAGAQCTVLGVSAFGNDLGSNYTTCIGWHAGFNAVTASNNSCIYIENVGVNNESNVIRIGQEGTSAHHQDKCYIAGIYGHIPGPIPQMVTIGNDGKLGTSGIPTGGATTFVTDSGTATVSGTTIQIKGGYNIGTRGSSNIVTIDLDDSIQQDITASDGSTGVYAMSTRGANTYATNRFMHAWGGGLGMAGKNTFLGYQAGRINALGVGLNHTALGYQALSAYTSASSCVAVGTNALKNVIKSGNNVAVGVNAGSGLTSSIDAGFDGNNILIGNSAGATYTTGFRNIILGDDSSSALGGAAEYRTMRLGYKQVWSVPAPDPHNPDPVETLTTHGTDNTYCYGIYKNTVAYSGTPVYVDHLGKLGTEGGVAFSFRQATALSNVTGDGTYYRIGTAAIANGGLVKDFDTTNSVVLGGMGAQAVFTAPYSGKYVFTACATYIIPAAPLPPPIPASTCTYILTSNLSYSFTAYIPDALVGTAQQVSEIVTSFVYLDAGDTVRWAVRISGTTKTIGLNNFQTGPSGELAYDTFFTGYRMA